MAIYEYSGEIEIDLSQFLLCDLIFEFTELLNSLESSDIDDYDQILLLELKKAILKKTKNPRVSALGPLLK
jgi:hypothetical protein